MDNNNQTQIDEGAKEWISVAFIAGLLSVPGYVDAQTIEKNIPNKASQEQIQNGLKKASESEKKFDGYTMLQLTNILTRTIFAEAKGESLEGKKMVATVIYNRAGGKLENMARVCFRNLQFSSWNNFTDKSPLLYQIKIPKSVSKDPKAEKAWKDCKDIIDSIVNGTFQPLGNWNAFLNPKTADPEAVNGWGTTMSNKKTVGKHRFGYLKEHDGFRKTSKKTASYPSVYVVKKTDNGVSFIAKNLIANKQTPIKDLKKLTDRIIALNNLGPKAVIHPNDKLKLPLKESFNYDC